MKILMITPYLPYPPSDGGRVRSYYLIRRLSEKHEIDLVCFTREHNSQEQIAHMQKFCRKVHVFERGKTWTIPNILRTGFSLYPFLVMIYYMPGIKEKLGALLAEQKYDLIHAETFYVMPYLPPHDIPTVLVEQTIMSRVFGHYVDTEKKWWLKPLMYIDVAKIGFWERYYWKAADRVVAVSEEDSKLMRKMVKNLNVDVVPNGVGEDFQKLGDDLHYNQTILYMGNYKWMQNWEAANILATQVFPLIKKAIPQAKLRIAGQFITPEVRGLKGPDVEIVALDDTDEKGVVENYQKSGLLVAPIYGPGGTRLKILAAMSAMIPVVTTPIGAEGYGAVDGTSILVGATPSEMATKAIKILKDKKYYAQVTRAAKKIVTQRFTWGPITQHLESIYREMVKTPSK